MLLFWCYEKLRAKFGDALHRNLVMMMASLEVIFVLACALVIVLVLHAGLRAPLGTCAVGNGVVEVLKTSGKHKCFLPHRGDVAKLFGEKLAEQPQRAEDNKQTYACFYSPVACCELISPTYPTKYKVPRDTAKRVVIGVGTAGSIVLLHLIVSLIYSTRNNGAHALDKPAVQPTTTKFTTA